MGDSVDAKAEQSQDSSLMGKVYLVTGAGQGIGRAVALELASYGAGVVVNDIAANDEKVALADLVVQEIHDAGGAAVASTDDISIEVGAEHALKCAHSAFGQIDGLVNNAGVLRDAIFHKMTFHDWRKVLDVNLTGAFLVSSAAARQFRAQSSGSYVHMTSTAGLIGNRGQANYMASKMGLVGLSRSIAIDMERFGVRSNAVAPFAWSQLTGTVPDRTEEDRRRLEAFRTMDPRTVAPLVTFLLGGWSVDITGQVFVVRRNEVFLMSQPRPIRSAHDATGWTPDKLAQKVLPAFRDSLVPLEISRDVFSWDPV